jgi:hypothetical protein
VIVHLNSAGLKRIVARARREAHSSNSRRSKRFKKNLFAITIDCHNMSDCLPPSGRFSPATGARASSSSRSPSPAAAASELLHLLNVNDRGDADNHSSFTLLHAPSTVSSLPSLPASRIVTRQQSAAAAAANQGASLLPSPSTPLRTGGGTSFSQQGGSLDRGGDGGGAAWLGNPVGIPENSGEFPIPDPFLTLFSDSGSGSDRISCSRQILAYRNYVPAKIFPNFFIGKLLPPFLLAW